MTKKNLAALVGALALAALGAGCTPAANENANANANRAAATENANTAVNANVAAPQKGTRQEYEKNKESYAQEAKRLGRKIGTGAEDLWLWTKVRYELATASDLKSTGIGVDVENAVVTLSGTVPTAPEKARAESIAKKEPGVKNVKNELKVSPPANANTKANANAKANVNAKANTNKKPY